MKISKNKKIERFIHETKSGKYRIRFFERNELPIDKTFMSLKEAQKFKDKYMSIHVKNIGKTCFKKKIFNKEFIYYFKRNNFYLLEKNLNYFNPELFDLSFIDSKYKVFNYQIINNILLQN